MQDSISNLRSQKDHFKFLLLDICDPNGRVNAKSDVNKYSVQDILSFCQQYLQTDRNNYRQQITKSYMGRMMGYYSELKQAKNDPAEYYAYISNLPYSQKLVSLFKNKLNSLHSQINQESSSTRTQTYNDPLANLNDEDKKIGRGFIDNMALTKKMNDFSKAHKNHRYGDIPFEWNGDQFYFSPKSNLFSNLKLVRYYFDHKAAYNRNRNLINNLYSSIKHTETTHHWFNFNDNDTFMARANRADGRYQYQTNRDMAWLLYYQQRIHNTRRSTKWLNNRLNKIQKKINQECIYHHVFYKNYNQIPNVERRKYINFLAQKRDLYRKELRSPENYIKYAQKKLNWWRADINSRNNKFGDHQQKYLGKAHYDWTVYNLKKDARFTHFGYIRPRNPNTDNSYIYFMVTDESPTYETNVSNTPVEWGVNMTTGTQKQQTTISVEGMLFNTNFSSLATADGKHGYFRSNTNDSSNPDVGTAEPSDYRTEHRYYWEVRDQAQRLAAWANQGCEMFYSGQMWYPHCVISEFNPDYNNSGDGGSETTISFNMTLTLCDYFNSNAKQKEHKSHHVGKKSNKRGKNNSHWAYVRAKHGYTYGYIARMKGVRVSDLEKWNKWPSRRIPIGAEIRYRTQTTHGRKHVHASRRIYRGHDNRRRK